MSRAIAEKIRYECDSIGRKTGTTDPCGLKTTYSYDHAGNCTGRLSPDAGMAAYHFDEYGNQISRIDADGLTTKRSFDAHNRLTAIRYPDASQDAEFRYDPNDSGDKGPISMCDSSGEHEFSYNDHGHLVTRKAVVLGCEYLTRYMRDGEGYVTRVLYPGGNLVEYQRDASGRISSVLLDGQAVVKNIVRTTGGLIRSMEHGNGLATSRKYDHGGRLVSQELTDIVNINLQYSHDGQITGVADLLDPSSNQAFEYDGPGRLIKAHGPYGSRKYTYDANGNRLSRVSDEGGETYAYNPGTNQVCQVNGPNARHIEYDQNGQIIQDGLTVMAYNQARRLSKVQVGDAPATHYTYNGLGQRVIKSHNGVVTVYHYDVEGRLIAESNQKGEMQKEYIWLDGELIAVLAGDELNFTHRDHRNQSTLVTNADGEATWKAVVSPFGRITDIQRPDSEKYRNFNLNLRLPGQYYDIETGYHYNYFRYYSPELGRYLQVDPIGLNGGMNLYAYCGGDPVNRRDEWGLMADPGADGFDGVSNDDDVDDNWGGGSGNDNNPSDDPENDDSGPAPSHALDDDDDVEYELEVEVDTKADSWNTPGHGYYDQVHQHQYQDSWNTPGHGYYDKTMTNQTRLDGWDQKGHAYNLRTDPKTGLPEFYDEQATLDKYKNAKNRGRVDIQYDVFTKDINFKSKSGYLEKAGNIAYGRLAAAAGMSLETAIAGAAAFQAYTDLKNKGHLTGTITQLDDPEDQEAIRRGYREYLDEFGRSHVDEDFDLWE